MKRLLICAGLVFALVLPATAGSATSVKTRSYSGSFNGGGTVDFKAKVKTVKKKHHKKKVKVTSLLGVPSGSRQIEQVPITCDQGDFSYSFAWLTNRTVKGNRFNITADATLHVVFKGKFVNNGRKATGTLQASGPGDPSHSNCDTGIVRWTATR